jgi:outer membrane protein OmpA-like peptidoglycan-associated protein
MKSSLLLCCLLIFAIHNTAIGQEELQLTSKDSIVQKLWILGLGYNAIDDSGNVFDGLFNVGEEWNILPYPSRLSIGKYFKNGLGIEAIGTYNKYKEGNIIDGVVNATDINYYAFDTRVSYDLNKIIGHTGWFDPYVGVGAGYSDANNVGRGTYNAVIGFRTWFSDKWGLDFNSSGKWAMSQSNGATNHIQHAAGIVYQFGIEKGLSKRGEEKLAMLSALEKERQRQMDSVAEVNRLKEEALLAERLKEEKEKAEMAAAERAKIDAENKRKSIIKDKIEALGFVYFDLNSSVINRKSQQILDTLSIIINDNPGLILKITSHTDSRGSSNYNDWLSQRRVERTKDYLLKKGIVSSQLTTEAFGERKLLNECDDNTHCSEEKHKVNRRSEFKIISI